jgi:hypothetical protein
VLASSLISTAAIASEVQVIHSDNKPIRCEMYTKGKVVETCSSFKLMTNGKTYAFSYSFKKNKILFITIPMDETKDIATYITREYYNNGKAHTIKDEEIIVCSRGKQIKMNFCKFGDFEFSYLGV